MARTAADLFANNGNDGDLVQQPMNSGNSNSENGNNLLEVDGVQPKTYKNSLRLGIATTNPFIINSRESLGRFLFGGRVSKMLYVSRIRSIYLGQYIHGVSFIWCCTKIVFLCWVWATSRNNATFFNSKYKDM